MTFGVITEDTNKKEEERVATSYRRAFAFEKHID
jgi:hypothetical protein